MIDRTEWMVVALRFATRITAEDFAELPRDAVFRRFDEARDLDEAWTETGVGPLTGRGSEQWTLAGGIIKMGIPVISMIPSCAGINRHSGANLLETGVSLGWMAHEPTRRECHNQIDVCLKHEPG